MGLAVSTIFEDKPYTAKNITEPIKNISQEKIDKIQKIIDGLNLTDGKFGTLKEYPSKN